MGISANSSSHNGRPAVISTKESQRRQRLVSAGMILAAVLIIAVFVYAIIYLLQPSTETAKIRDSFIILMSLELLFVGFSFVILIYQIARLVNLVQNEIKPLLKAANDTINTVRGTASFLSFAFVEPVVKINAFLASFRKIMDMLKVNI
ncbi:MAG: hypothetical protein OEY93_10455 [Anaerolineae bacterium]|nr:hypothetical protein [Anaerolineae bacterium]